ncbi:MAG: peptidoglycan-associated lipoprotein Pal [Desulfobacteraceae bacterium]|nr:peptidoglycan-associated lipoprotein Pal [Desulfobacteraceae bacterium]
MKNRMWINVVMAILVAGLFFTVSCAKKTVYSDGTTIEDRSGSGGQSGVNGSAGGGSDSEAAIQQSKIMAAKKRFGNQDVHFEYDSAVLSPMAKMVIKEKAAWLKDNGSVSVSVEGHCDDRGTTEYNLALGERRANAAKSYLVNLGIAASRLTAITYGEEKPIDSGKTESAYRKNRRVHFAIN